MAQIHETTQINHDSGFLHNLGIVIQDAVLTIPAIAGIFGLTENDRAAEVQLGRAFGQPDIRVSPTERAHRALADLYIARELAQQPVDNPIKLE